MNRSTDILPAGEARCRRLVWPSAACSALTLAISLVCAPVGAQAQEPAPTGPPAQPAAGGGTGGPAPAAPAPAATAKSDDATEELRREVEILKQQVADLQKQRGRRHPRPGAVKLQDRKEPEKQEPKGEENGSKKSDGAPAGDAKGASPAGKEGPSPDGKEASPDKGDGEPSDDKDAGPPDEQDGGFQDRYTPGAGYDVAKTKYGLLNIGGYMLFRYLNQMPNSKTFTDHLGNVRPTEARNDLQWHRALVYLRGWLYTPKLTFSDSIWGLQSSNQMSMVGSLNYQFGKSFVLSGGILSLPGTYTLLFNFPYWLGTDRVMANEFFRPGFTGGLSATGDLGNRLNYTAMVGNTISQLGVPAFHLTRDHAYSADLAWMPTTGEYGPRNEVGDYHEHRKVATRFDAFYTFSREDRFSQPSEDSPENTQIRLSDSVLFFEAGALAPGVTVDKADYNLLSAHLGVKHLGTSVDVELYKRWLNTFRTIGGPAPLDAVRDEGYYVQASRMVVNRELMLYGFHSYVFGQFNDAWEAGSGINWYPFGQRNFRINGQGLYVFKSPASSQFGYYSAGMTGGIWSLATDMLF